MKNLDEIFFVDGREKSEGRIQQEIVQYLQSLGIFCHSVPNEAGGRSQVMQTKLVAMGLHSGVADLVVWIPSAEKVEIVYFEVKDRKGKQTERQKIFEKKCRDNSVDYFLVRSVRDVELVLKNKGVI